MLVVALITAPVAVGQEKPDFSGTWSLDLQMTRFNGVEPPKALVLTIDHREPQISITSETETKAGMKTDSFQLATDGTPGDCRVSGQPAVTSARWDQWTGERLVWTVTRDTAQGPVEISRLARLGDKGKILTTVVTVKTSAGEQKYYEFYVKK
jgi:hypothetical protein